MNATIYPVPEIVNLSERGASSAEIMSHSKTIPLMCYLKYYATVEKIPVLNKDWKQESVIEAHIK